MSDDPTRIQPEAPEPDDADEELAAALAVEPLDDVTRRRLVRAALTATPRVSTPRRNRAIAALGVAAAVVIGIVIGTVVVTRPDDPQQNTAAPAAPKTAADGAASANTDAAADTAPKAAANPAASETPVTLFGEIGAYTNAADLRAKVITALDATKEPVTGPANLVACGDVGPDVTGLEQITAVGAGRFVGGDTVAVLVGTTASGEGRVVTLDTQNCAIVTSVAL
jgi:hypothetical protein